MIVLKKGIKGSEVKKLQELLNKNGFSLIADGDFGLKTEAAVKEFQKKKNLVADGIVGPKTWEALGINIASSSVSNSKCVDPSVIYSPINVHITKLNSRPIKYIAIHYTAGGSSKPGSAQAVKRAFEKRPASADFAVDDRDMVQFNPDINNYYCWSVGDKKNPYSGGGKFYGYASNRNTVSIEMCSNLTKGITPEAAKHANHKGWYLTDETINNAIKLTKILMKKFNIPIDRVVRHYDVSGKLCPGIPGWNDGPLYTEKGVSTKEKNNSSVWEAFKKSLK